MNQTSKFKHSKSVIIIIINMIIFFIPDTADMLIHTEVHVKEST